MRASYQSAPFERLGEPLPREVIRSAGALRVALDVQLAAEQDASRARQGLYDLLDGALPDDHFWCYQVRDEQEVGLAVPESEAVHKARIARGRVILGKIILLPPDTYSHIAELVPLIPNWNPRRVKPLLLEKTQRVRVALPDLGNITKVDWDIADELVGNEEQVVDPGELVNIFRTRKRGDPSRQHASRQRGKVLLRSV